jgi:precorrin-2 dehydrogenase/sirohydrochlorin ferrochelatase
MRYYPIFVNLENKPCLVVGAGGVGKRKARTLLEAGASPVLIVDTHPADGEIEEILTLGNAHFECRSFEDADLDNQFMVIACTSNESVNHRISEQCTKRDILCNIVDDPESGSFIVPSSIKQGDLTLAISTGGNSPAMTKRIRRELQDFFGEEYAHMLTIMGRLRPLLLSLSMETSKNTAVFRALVDSSLLDALKVHNLDAAREILKESLPQPLHANILELLDGLA